MDRTHEKLTAAAAKAGYDTVTEKWCIAFLNEARTNGRERSVKETLRERFRHLYRGREKRFVCFRQILLVYEGKRPVDFMALRDVHDQIIRSNDRMPKGEIPRSVALFSTAVSIELYRNARRKDRLPDAELGV